MYVQPKKAAPTGGGGAHRSMVDVACPSVESRPWTQTRYPISSTAGVSWTFSDCCLRPKMILSCRIAPSGFSTALYAQHVFVSTSFYQPFALVCTGVFF